MDSLKIKTKIEIKNKDLINYTPLGVQVNLFFPRTKIENVELFESVKKDNSLTLMPIAQGTRVF